MLGREVATPLDVMYEMPPSVSDIPQHKWVWEPKARLEEDHSAVRHHTGQEMRRQKRYHDAKVNWQTFKKADKVYVFFPQRKAGHSPKFTSFWRGPYTVVDKKSDLLYEVDCGPRGKNQVIHVDRLRLQKPQLLAGEVDDGMVKGEDHDIDDSNESELEEDVYTPESLCENKRTRKPPVWLQDYVRY